MNPPRTRPTLRRHLLAVAAAAFSFASAQAAVSVTVPPNTFGDFTESITYGSTGSVFLLEPYVFITGLNNGDAAKSVTDLSSALSFSFSSANKTAGLLTIDYTITNLSASKTFDNLRFMVYANPDGNPGPSYADVLGESWGAASADGPVSRRAITATQPDIIRSEFRVANTLADTGVESACALAAGCDAVIALQWNAAQLKPGEQFVVQVGLSDDGSTLSSRFLTATAAGAAGTELTFSGTGMITAVPEPSSWAIMLAGLGAMGMIARRKAGSRQGKRNG